MSQMILSRQRDIMTVPLQYWPALRGWCKRLREKRRSIEERVAALFQVGFRRTCLCSVCWLSNPPAHRPHFAFRTAVRNVNTSEALWYHVTMATEGNTTGTFHRPLADLWENRGVRHQGSVMFCWCAAPFRAQLGSAGLLCNHLFLF